MSEHKIVPFEPDLVQVNAAIEAVTGADLESDIRTIYKAMIADAPPCDQSENERLRAQLGELVAVNQVMRDALQEVVNVFETPDHPGICDTVWVTGNRPETLYDCVVHVLKQKEGM